MDAPGGAQFGRLIKIGGKLPLNMLVGAYYNALRPEGGPTWQLRTQIALIFLNRTAKRWRNENAALTSRSARRLGDLWLRQARLQMQDAK